MSDFDVDPDGMMNRGLSDADIDALIDGAPVPDAPAPLIELLASLRQRAAAAPTVAPSGALQEFIGSAPAPTHVETSDTHREPPVTTRRLLSLLSKAGAVLGLVPTYALVGATAAAAAVGSAQMLGVVDVPLLPDRGHRIELPKPDPEPAPEPPASVTSEFPQQSNSPESSPTATHDRRPNLTSPQDGPALAGRPTATDPLDDSRPRPTIQVPPGHTGVDAAANDCADTATRRDDPPTEQHRPATIHSAGACEPPAPVTPTPDTHPPVTPPPVRTTPDPPPIATPVPPVTSPTLVAPTPPTPAPSVTPPTRASSPTPTPVPPLTSAKLVAPTPPTPAPSVTPPTRGSSPTPTPSAPAKPTKPVAPTPPAIPAASIPATPVS